jgi:hypothetical protein
MELKAKTPTNSTIHSLERNYSISARKTLFHRIDFPLCKSRFDKSLESKKIILKKQSFKAKAATLNLRYFTQKQNLIKFCQNKIRSYELQENNAAKKIQKCFRKYLSRKSLNLSNNNEEIHKLLDNIKNLPDSINRIFLSSPITIKVFFI